MMKCGRCSEPVAMHDSFPIITPGRLLQSWCRRCAEEWVDENMDDLALEDSVSKLCYQLSKQKPTE